MLPSVSWEHGFESISEVRYLYAFLPLCWADTQSGEFYRMSNIFILSRVPNLNRPRDLTSRTEGLSIRDNSGSFHFNFFPLEMISQRPCNKVDGNNPDVFKYGCLKLCSNGVLKESARACARTHKLVLSSNPCCCSLSSH
jgi:hypothetical protein